MSDINYIYEQPLNERIRMFLRIEALISKLDYFRSLENEQASYQAVLSILEITTLVERGDIKQEIIKELERENKVLNVLVSHQGVDKSRLELTLSRIKNALNNMHNMDGKLGEHLKVIDFLLTIKQRAAIPGGSCDFDVPELRFWLNQSHQRRLEDINRWAAPYYQVFEVIRVVLNLIRESAHGETVTATNGFYQENLDTSISNQMIRIELDLKSTLFPEISAGKHRYSIRFLSLHKDIDHIPLQMKEDVQFKLYRCAL